MYIIISDFYLNMDLWRFQNSDSMSDFATFKSRQHAESNETIGTHLFLDESIQYIAHQSDLINDWIIERLNSHSWNVLPECLLWFVFSASIVEFTDCILSQDEKKGGRSNPACTMFTFYDVFSMEKSPYMMRQGPVSWDPISYPVVYSIYTRYLQHIYAAH